MSALAGAGAVHSMPSYELCKRGVLVQERFGVAFTQLMKPCAISALKALALDDAKHRETHPARSRLAPSAARTVVANEPQLVEQQRRARRSRRPVRRGQRRRERRHPSTSRALAAARARPTEASCNTKVTPVKRYSS